MVATHIFGQELTIGSILIGSEVFLTQDLHAKLDHSLHRDQQQVLSNEAAGFIMEAIDYSLPLTG